METGERDGVIRTSMTQVILGKPGPCLTRTIVSCARTVALYLHEKGIVVDPALDSLESTLIFPGMPGFLTGFFFSLTWAVIVYREGPCGQS